MESTSLAPGRMLLIAVTAVVLLALLLRPGDPVVSRWAGGLRPAGDAAPPPIVAEAVPVATSLLQVAVDDGLYADQRADLDAELRHAYAVVSGRFGGTLLAPVTVRVVHDGSCGLSGVAYTDVRVVQVHTCDGIARPRAVAIMAHEYVHQLQQDRYGPPHLSADLILSEGMATWGAGEYWLAGHPDFRSYVRAQRASGVSYPLATHYAGLGVGAMNALYYQWASFVEYLVGAYGREAFDQLYVSGAGAPGSADYLGVYGKPLEALEAEWIAWLGS